MRIVLIILLIGIATLAGGLYGALFDQITYTISPEFFTKMRFPQYEITGDVNERWEAAKMGFRNAWGVGLGLGCFLSVAGLLHSDNKKMFWSTLKSFGIALFLSFFFGMIAFLFVEPVMDKIISMNNYSYVGGTIGMFLGLGWQVLNNRRKEQK